MAASVAIGRAIAFILLMAAAWHEPRASWAGAGERPNIVLILADDLGFGDIGVYGQEKILTPNLDQLAREGMRFTAFYAASPDCRPSRYSLLTGFHQGHAFIRSNRRGRRFGTLREQDRTIAKALQEVGYVTGGFGKWALGDQGTTGSPDKHGFDHWFGFLDQERAHRHYVDYLWRNGEKVPTDPESDYSHDLIVDEALDFLRAHHRGPLFIYLALTLPHPDITVPEDSMAQYRGVFEEVPFGRGSRNPHHYAAQAEPRAAYAGMVSRIDRDVGRLVALLEELGIDERTIVLLTSDNGPAGGGGADTEFFASSGLLRGSKRDLYEGGIRVPMIARWPGRIRANETSSALAASWDVPATLAELAGLAAPVGGDGVSFLPTLLGDMPPERGVLYWESYSQYFKQALRLGDWKVIRPHPEAALELYDLANDPGEAEDLSATHADVVARLARLMEAEHVPPPFPLKHGFWEAHAKPVAPAAGIAAGLALAAYLLYRRRLGGRRRAA